ncbi:MAG: class I SAM-dependent methyltransferase [Oscillospiraceae bacterium]|nr:class I SAM-dependent methyltransferase [Oscillospiraceae bacterium]
MKILFGRTQQEVEPSEFAARLRGRCPVHIDVGTGSGRLVLKHALKNPNGIFIGIDPSAASMHESALKAAKLARKTGPDNLLFVVCAIESPPMELLGLADRVSVILPWGSLRDGVVKVDSLVLGNLRKLGKPGATLEILVGYDGRNEPFEMEKRSLPALSCGYFASLTPQYRHAGIEILRVRAVKNEELKQMESDWAKKLAYGGERTLYRLECRYL